MRALACALVAPYRAALGEPQTSLPSPRRSHALSASLFRVGAVARVAERASSGEGREETVDRVARGGGDQRGVSLAQRQGAEGAQQLLVDMRSGLPKLKSTFEVPST